MYLAQCFIKNMNRIILTEFEILEKYQGCYYTLNDRVVYYCRKLLATYYRVTETRIILSCKYL